MKAFIDPDLLRRLRIGPLATYFDSYLKRIEQEGFLPSSVPMQMYAIARFSKWLHTRHLEARMVDETVIDLFLKRQGEVRHGADFLNMLAWRPKRKPPTPDFGVLPGRGTADSESKGKYGADRFPSLHVAQPNRQ